ncbi:SO_0444 family Cu/Zn efflux transporter [Magnetovibrio sp. PR-2]|uniref:SO_0444 family Cu/Zn efflux transporter n=1 Tax=Magnetovibrio sp. PR-2 TaxID=3120356 RepID=UPI002FCE6893
MPLFFENLLHLSLEAAPWLLFGLLVAGLIHAWVPQDGLAKILGGRGFRSVLNGALVGAPLPICSCGVLPAAIGLRRGGASREATTSFLVSTPETGVDSVALSYAMLGPFLAVARPIAAVFSAIVTGLLMRLLPPEKEHPTKLAVQDAPVATTSSCCSSGCCATSNLSELQTSQSELDAIDQTTKPSALSRTLKGLSYALFDIFDDIALWLLVGLVLAAATVTWVPPQTLGQYGSGLFAMVVMVLVGIPMYICATASTPVAASFILAGVSPGAAMVFMLAGPATNIATLGVVRREMGNQAVALYLTGIICTAIGAGFVTDAVAQAMGVDMAVQLSKVEDIVPYWVSYGALAILLAISARITWGALRTRLQKTVTTPVA